MCTKILPPWFPYSGKQSDTQRPRSPAWKSEDLLRIRYKKNHSVCWCCVDQHRLSKHSLGQWHIFIVKLRVTHWPYKGCQSLILQGVLPREREIVYMTEHNESQQNWDWCCWKWPQLTSTFDSTVANYWRHIGQCLRSTVSMSWVLDKPIINNYPQRVFSWNDPAGRGSGYNGIKIIALIRVYLLNPHMTSPNAHEKCFVDNIDITKRKKIRKKTTTTILVVRLNSLPN